MPFQTIVLDALRFGAENAIRTKDLAQALGFSSVRALQQVERERNAGAVILCDPSGRGYFRSNDPEELARFARTLTARAQNTAKAARSAQAALDAALGLQSMEGWHGE